MNKGQITIPITLALAVGGIVVSALTSYTTAQISTAKDFSSDRERIATLEEAVTTIKTDIGLIKTSIGTASSDISEIKGFIKSLK